MGLPPVSDYSSRKEWEKVCWNKILNSKKLLEILVAPYERRNFVLRAAVVDLLGSGKSYREIGDELWLSSQTISSIKKALIEKGYKSYRERGKTERKKRVWSNYPRKKKESYRRYRRTKYGKVYMP